MKRSTSLQQVFGPALFLGISGCLSSGVISNTPVVSAGDGNSSSSTTQTPLTFQSAAISLSAANQFSLPAPTFDSSVSDSVRDGHRAVVLHTGTGLSSREKVFVTGGQNPNNLIGTSMTYDPQTNTWSGAPSMSIVRYGHSANVIKIGSDQHEAVLVVGGFNDPGNPIPANGTAEIYDPTGGAGGTPAWRAAASPLVAHGYHTATTLSNGKVLIIAGSNDFYGRTGNTLGDAEIYNPANDSWTSVPALSPERIGHTATRIKIGLDAHDGVLVTGGQNNAGVSQSTAQIFDTASNTWLAAGTVPFASVSQAAVALADGSVIMSGGQDENYNKYNDSVRYVPSLTGTASTTWTSVGQMNGGRYNHTLTLLPNGKALTIGGYGGGPEARSELYSGSSSSWAVSASTTIYRYGHTTTLLSDGRAVVFGGDGGTAYGETPMTQAQATEIYQTYGSAQITPTSGTAPYTYALTSGSGKIYSNGTYVPNQYGAESAVITVTDALGAHGSVTVTTTP